MYEVFLHSQLGLCYHFLSHFGIVSIKFFDKQNVPLNQRQANTEGRNVFNDKQSQNKKN